MIFDQQIPEDFEELMYQRANCLLGEFLAVTYGAFDLRFMVGLRYHAPVYLIPTSESSPTRSRYIAEAILNSRNDARVVLLHPRPIGVVLQEDVEMIARLDPVVYLYTTSRRLASLAGHMALYCYNVHLRDSSGGEVFVPRKTILGPNGQPIKIPEVA